MSTKPLPRISGERMNRLHDRLLQMALQKKRFLLEEVYRSGYPPGASPVPAYQEYQNLLELRASGDPRFFQNPQAQADLDRLAERFGSPAPFVNPQIAAQYAAQSVPLMTPGGFPVQIPRLLTEMESRHAIAATIHEKGG